MKRFSDFSLKSDLISALEKNGFINPTEIQEKTIEALLQSPNEDLHGQAQTGTGKTLAFGIPILNQIDIHSKKTQVLIVAPTRELVVQIFQSIEPFAKSLGVKIAPIYGGVSIEKQFGDLKRGIQIVVGTPGRINDHLRRKSLKLDEVQTVVLDEADIMLDMGFKEEMDEILKYAKKDRNIWLFSATVKPGIKDLMRSHMSDPISIRISPKNVTNSSTKQYFCVVPFRSKFNALCRFIEKADSFYGFVFCRTKMQASEVAEKLIARGYAANALHGDMSQVNRNRVIKGFKSKQFTVLVATDVAARGIDVQDISHVINYNIPEDQESYVHRIGRTGRAGKEGVAITFTSNREKRKIRDIEYRFKSSINEIAIPSLEDLTQKRVQKVADYLTTVSEESVKNKPFVAPLKVVLEQLSTDKLNTVMLRLVEDAFFKQSYDEEIVEEKGGDFERSHRSRGQRGQRTAYKSNPNCTELRINIGSDDGVTKRDIIECLTATNTIKSSHIAKIRVINRRTFVEVPSKSVRAIINDLEKHQIAGRRLRVTPVKA